MTTSLPNQSSQSASALANATRSRKKLEEQLENLRHEAYTACQYVYIEMALHHAASQSKRLLSRINATPLFWNVVLASLQSAAYVSLARMYEDDDKAKFNLISLLRALDVHLEQFGREALRVRKMEHSSGDPPWLDEYVAAASELSRSDVGRLRRRVRAYRTIYERAVRPARHNYIAHRKVRGDRAQDLFKKGTVKDMWRLSTFLLRMHAGLEQAYVNGRKLRLRPVRLDTAEIYASPTGDDSIHERAVREVRRFLNFLEHAGPPGLLDE